MALVSVVMTRGSNYFFFFCLISGGAREDFCHVCSRSLSPSSRAVSVCSSSVSLSPMFQFLPVVRHIFTSWCSSPARAWSSVSLPRFLSACGRSLSSHKSHISCSLISRFTVLPYLLARDYILSKAGLAPAGSWVCWHPRGTPTRPSNEEIADRWCPASAPACFCIWIHVRKKKQIGQNRVFHRGHLDLSLHLRLPYIRIIALRTIRHPVFRTRTHLGMFSAKVVGTDFLDSSKILWLQFIFHWD